jgi:hypothetical protein
MDKEKPKYRRLKKIEGAKYKRPIAPRARTKPWLTVIIRAEHYAMLRELGQYYRVPIGKMASSMILQRFLEILKESDPEMAAALEEEHRNDKDLADLLDLGR